MKISLIGMSGAGKSKSAGEISKLGYKLFDCDKLISQKLITSGIPIRQEKFFQDMGSWLGYPWMDTFREREAQYMQAEEEAMLEILNEIEACDKAVLDTTGSVIYCSSKIHNKLKALTKVIYISVPDEDIELLINYYRQNPRPILWLDFYKPLKELSNEQNLSRCYRNLLADRILKYKSLRAVEIDRKLCWDYRDPNDLLSLFLRI